MMELSSTILKVLAVQLGDAASTRQMPPAYHHRDALTSCSLSAGCTLQVAGGRRATLMDVLLMPVARQNSAAACWLSAVCSVHPCVRGGGGGGRMRAWEQVGLHGNLESGVQADVVESARVSCTFGVLLVTFGAPMGRWELKRYRVRMAMSTGVC